MDEIIVPMCSPAYLESGNIRTIPDLCRANLLHQSGRTDAWSDWLAAVGYADMNAKHGPRFFR